MINGTGRVRDAFVRGANVRARRFFIGRYVRTPRSVLSMEITVSTDAYCTGSRRMRSV